MKIFFPCSRIPRARRSTPTTSGTRPREGKAEGVPHPGTFILDREGVIRSKLFLEGYRDRHTTDALIKAARAVK